MDTKEYSLLEKEICARLPYNLKVQYKLPNYQTNEFDTEEGIAFCVNLGMGLVDIHGGGIDYNISIHKVKPMLRPMSDMTEEEQEEYDKLCHHFVQLYAESPWEHKDNYFYDLKAFEWLNKHQLDYNGLIEMGLAVKIENKIKENRTITDNKEI